MLPKQESTEPIDRARAYKSRNKRPCDFCRYKKAACHLETAPPCELCVRYGKECTFVESPAKRRRPNVQTQNAVIEDVKANLSLSREICAGTGVDPMAFVHQSHHARMDSMDLYPPPPSHQPDHLLSWEAGLPSFVMDPTLIHDFPFDPQLFHEPLPFDPLEPMSASATSSESPEIFSHESHGSTDSMASPTSPSLGLVAGLPSESVSNEHSFCRRTHMQMVGSGGELDPDLLSRCTYDENNETSFGSTKVRRMISATAEVEEDRTTNIPSFFIIEPGVSSRDSQAKWKRELEALIPSAQGTRLVQLYYGHVQPAFPVLPLPQSTIQSPQATFPPHLLAAIYAHALTFLPSDTHLSMRLPASSSSTSLKLQDALFTLSHTALQSVIQAPDLTVIQALLLHLQRSSHTYALEAHSSGRGHCNLNEEYVSAATWATMCQTLGLAQSLGLDQDCSAWTTMSSEERKLRKRLSWGLWVTEKWLAAGLGRRSLAGNVTEEWQVPMLTSDDFLADADGHGERSNAHDSLSPTSPSSSLEAPHAHKKRKREGEDMEVNIADAGHFIHLCSLTEIFDDILTELYSTTAMRKLRGNLEGTLEVAKPLRLRLGEWHRGLPVPLSATLSTVASTTSSLHFTSPRSDAEDKALEATTASPHHSASTILDRTNATPATSSSTLLSSASPDQPRSSCNNAHSTLAHPSMPSSTASLHLSYIAAKVLLFRALLRASSSLPVAEDTPSCPALEALRLGCLATAHEILSFVRILPLEDFASSFWPGYAAQQIGTASSFLLLLAHTAAEGQGQEEKELVMQWVGLLRVKRKQLGVLGKGLKIAEDGLEGLSGGMPKSEA